MVTSCRQIPHPRRTPLLLLRWRPGTADIRRRDRSCSTQPRRTPSHPCPRQVPVKEGLAAEHASELLGHTLERLLDGSRVANEAGGHFEALWRNVAHRTFDI